MLTVGIKGKEEIVVTDANSAKTMGSGTLDVFATPAMIALMEKTAWKSVAPYLEEGCGTVGTLLNVTHDAPTPLGMKVWCESELTEIDGRRLVFSVAAFDETGKIGGGRHERFVTTILQHMQSGDWQSVQKPAVPHGVFLPVLSAITGHVWVWIRWIPSSTVFTILLIPATMTTCFGPWSRLETRLLAPSMFTSSPFMVMALVPIRK